MDMRGIYTSVTKLRRQVFTEIARLAYEGGDLSRIEELPYKIVPGEVATYRESIFLERAIIGERLRLAMGLPVRPITQHAPLAQGIEEAAKAEKFYDPPLVNIISIACHSCPRTKVLVTDGCQGCLARPCMEVCPKKAIYQHHGRSHIDPDKCVKCGKCVEVCPYHAIIKQERPCEAACGMGAISSDELGRCSIDYDKCVSCGQCIVNCPFGAIADKSQIFQLIQAIKRGDEMIAAVAPAFVGQFGPRVHAEQIKEAMKEMGFAGIYEVAVGADLCTIEEAKDFMEKVPAEQEWMGTSCCPAWSVMAKKTLPDKAGYISMTLTPMVLTARLIKKEHPNARVVFIGPCSAKKLEASRRSVRSDVDFVLTFEELRGMLEAKGINLETVKEEDVSQRFNEGSGDGRGFAVGGGVASAVVNAIKRMDPDRDVLVDSAQGLKECRKMLMLAKAGKRNGYLLEGMACPGGCVAGAGTLLPVAKSTAIVGLYKKAAPVQESMDSKYAELADEIYK